MAMRLEQFAHALRRRSPSAAPAQFDLGGSSPRGVRLERRRTFVDTEAVQKFALPDRAVDAAADAFRALRQRLEIDMSGEIGLARRAQRIGEGVSGDRLQRLAQAVMRWP